MEKLNGLNIDNLGFIPQKMGDLLVHDGTLLSHFTNSKNSNEHYIYKWSDCDEYCNRWLIFKINNDEIIDFFEKKINWLDLIRRNSYVYFIDLDNEIEIRQIILCSTNSIPIEYLPSDNSFFKEKKYEKYALDLYNKITKERDEIDTNTILELLLTEIKHLKLQQTNTNSLINSFLSVFISKPHKSTEHPELKDIFSNYEEFTTKKDYSISEKSRHSVINEQILN